MIKKYIIMIKSTLKRYRLISIPYRICYGLSYYKTTFKQIIRWSFHSRELHSFTYNLMPNNLNYLFQCLYIVTNVDFQQIKKYYNEFISNEELFKRISNIIAQSELRFSKDIDVKMDNRFLHYCIIRATKPKIVVENGIEIGLTSILMCEALLKNQDDGFLGRYIGFDIDSEAGLLIKNSIYSDISDIVIGDSLLSLSVIEGIDYYFSDGERSKEYELAEFELLKNKISNHGIVVSNKVNISDCASTFALTQNKKFIYFREDPLLHWYPGTHFGIVF